MPVDATIDDPTAEPNDWKGDVLDPWVSDVSGTIATLEAIPTPATYVSPTRKNLSYHYSGNLQTAIDDHATWGELWVPKGTYNHSTPVEEPVGLGPGKIICGENREDSIINHTGSNQPIYIQRDGVHSVILRNLALRYSGQQTNASHPNSRAIAFQLESGDSAFGGYWRRYESLRIDKATIAMGVLESTAGYTGVWGTVLDDVLIVDTSHTALDLSPSTGGSPSVSINNLQIHNGDSLASTGPALNLVAVEAMINALDIEKWTGTAIDATGANKLTIYNLHIEHHKFNSANPRLFILTDGDYEIYNPWLSFAQHNVSSVGYLFEINTASVYAPHVRTTMQAAVTAGNSLVVRPITPLDVRMPGYKYLDIYSVASPFVEGAAEGWGPTDASLAAISEWGAVHGGAQHQGTIATSGTIDTSYPATLVTHAAAVTGLILEAGVIRGQRLTVINDSTATATFATDATSRVLGGTGVSIAANTAKDFVWYPNTAASAGRWWPV